MLIADEQLQAVFKPKDSQASATHGRYAVHQSLARVDRGGDGIKRKIGPHVIGHGYRYLPAEPVFPADRHFGTARPDGVYVP